MGSMTQPVAVIATLISICISISTSSAAQRKIKPPEKQELTQYIIAEVLALNDEIIITTTAYKDHLLIVLENQQLEFARLSKEVDLQQKLLKQGLISQKEFEDNEQAMAMANYSIKITKQRIAGAEKMIVDTQAETDATMMQQGIKELENRTAGATEPKVPTGGSGINAVRIRYDGKAQWSLADSGKIEIFFYSRFGYSLPVSAWSGTDLHRRMRLDHRNAMDVALNPDSPEGQALMNYLRDADIPFMAFRGRVAGASTGAHIHIGKPSLRLASP